MYYQEAIDKLQHETGFQITGKSRKIAEFFEALDVAISAIQEVQEYKHLGTLEEFRKLKECELSGVQLAEIACSLNRLKEYQNIGTLKEVLEAVEKQKAKKPEKKNNAFIRGVESHSCHCPNCKFRFINKDDNGFYNGIMTKFCPNCGQHIDWPEEEE